MRRRKDAHYNGLIYFLAIFILGCTITHLIYVVNVWNPTYQVESVIKVMIALASVGTAVMLMKVTPQLIQTQDLDELDRISYELDEKIRLLKEKDKTILLLKAAQNTETIQKTVSEEQFHALADNIPNLAWIANGEGWIYWYNKRWYEYTGKTPSEMEGWGWQSVHDPEVLPGVLDKWTSSIKTGEPFDMIFPLKAADKTFRPFLTRVVPVKDQAGTITNWFGTNTDISDRVQAEELLKEQNKELVQFRELAVDEMQNKTQLLNGILQYAPVIVYKINSEGTITNAMGSGIKSISPQKSIDGMRVEDLSLDISINKIYNDGENFRSYISQGMLNGREWYFDNYFFPDRVSNNGGIIGIGMEITAQKEISKQLNYEKERAQNASYFKTRFLANMSHEIRTPLNAIMGFAEVLTKQELEREKQKEYLNHINSSGSLLLKLIGDILDLSKIEEGKLSLQDESFYFKEVLSSAILPYKFKANEKGLTFSLHFDEFIPDYVIGDCYRIKQVVINLIGNALKFTEQGKINIWFSNETNSNTKEECNITIKISDTGIGVNDENKKAIFQSFTQADSTVVRKYGGSGLGLSIVKQLVDKMGGEIWVEDNHEGQGSIFFVTLKLKVDNSKTKPLLSDKGPSFQKLSFKNEIKILTVEDNPINQDLVAIVLKSLGAKVDFANNGVEGIEKFKQNTYDLILMDVQMPVMGGFEATRIIRTMNASIPVIGLTANVYKEDIDNCKAAGMTDHLGKPFSEFQMYTTISRWVEDRN
ncbi:MAG TPA: ATP-binding protein [Cytophagaceae bacterium]